MKAKYLILFLSVLFCSTLSAEIAAPGNFKNPDAVKNASVFVLSSLERMLQDDTDAKGLKEAEIFCAKNEYESFQIIIANPTDELISSINLKSGNWHFTGTPDSDAPEITLFREHYIQIKKTSPYSKESPGWYPDALIPFINPYTGKKITHAKYMAINQNIAPHKSQGYWVDIYISTDVKAGIYTNKITIFSNNKELADVPIKLTVLDFELPKVSALKTFFGEIYDVSGFHGMKASSVFYKTIYNRYMALARDHRLTVGFSSNKLKVNSQTGGITFTPSYVSELRAFVDEMQPTVISLPSNFWDKPVQRSRYLTEWQAFLSNNPWVVNPILFYDEPRTQKAYRRIIDYGAAIHKYAPIIKFLVTEQIEPQSPEFPSLQGSVDIWVPIWHLGNPENIRMELQKGNKVWSYNALTQSRQVPIWLLDYPLLNYRIPAWFSISMQLEGLLYWQMAAWARKETAVDPLTSSKTCRINSLAWNGEGSLIYPGAEAEINGPLPSMRLKVLRDGMEDYDYLWIGESE